MAHPCTHAESSARRFGGAPEDYIEIHEWFDATKAWFPDNRHRAFRHHSEGIFECERVFGREITLTGGKTAKVRYVGEQHVLEDFGNKFIPTAADYLESMEMMPWLNNGVKGHPNSHRRVAEAKLTANTRRMTYLLD